MHITSRIGRGVIRLSALAILIAATTSCGLEKQSAPPLAGPSEFSTSITLLASPDTLPRDGESQSQILVIARDAQNNPAPRFTLTLFANAGTLSAQQVDVVNGQAAVPIIYTAPSLQQVVNTAVISAVPVGTNIDNAVSRSVSIALLAPAGATPQFTITPANLVAFQLATLDASATTLDGAACGSACTYAWAFGTEATASGQVVTYRFQQEGSYVVTLTVTSPGGVQTTRQQVVTVGPGVAPTAAFTFSPTDPRPGDTVRFDASTSIAANGATIESYAWDFGNGMIGTGVNPTTTYAAGLERTYLVRLTVTDNRGRTHSVTQQIQVAF